MLRVSDFMHHYNLGDIILVDSEGNSGVVALSTFLDFKNPLCVHVNKYTFQLTKFIEYKQDFIKEVLNNDMKDGVLQIQVKNAEHKAKIEADINAFAKDKSGGLLHKIYLQLFLTRYPGLNIIDDIVALDCAVATQDAEQIKQSIFCRNARWNEAIRRVVMKIIDPVEPNENGNKSGRKWNTITANSLFRNCNKNRMDQIREFGRSVIDNIYSMLDNQPVEIKRSSLHMYDEVASILGIEKLKSALEILRYEEHR